MPEETAASAATETVANPGSTQAPAPAAGASDSGAPPKTLLSGNGQDTAPQAPAATWPDDWRQRFAGEDKSDLKALDKMTDPSMVWKKAKSLEQKLSSGEYKRVAPFPDKGTDEEKAAWRAEQGIPEAPDKYDTAVGDGFVWGETDKPVLDDYTAFAHSRNLSADQVKTNLDWYRQMQQKMVDARDQKDADYRRESEDTLRSEWGAEYRPNINAIDNMMRDAPAGVREAILGGRTAEGQLIGDHPGILAWLAQTAREMNPAATMLPAGNANAQGLSARMKEFDAMIKDRRSEYYRGQNAESLQEEYRTLLAAKARQEGKAA